MRAKKSVLGRIFCPVAAPAPSHSSSSSPSIIPGCQRYKLKEMFCYWEWKSVDLLLESMSLKRRYLFSEPDSGWTPRGQAGSGSSRGWWTSTSRRSKPTGWWGSIEGSASPAPASSSTGACRNHSWHQKDSNHNFFYRGLYFGLFDSLKPLGEWTYSHHLLLHKLEITLYLAPAGDPIPIHPT